MARLAVRVEDFEDGAFAHVCVSSGIPADRPYERTASYMPRWPVVFMLLGPVGLIVMLIAMAGLQRSVTGELPMADATYAQLRQEQRTHWRHALEVVVATVLLTVGLYVRDYGRPTLLVGAVGLVAAAAFCAAGSRPKGSIGIELARNGRTVELTGVDDGFVECYEAQERRRRAKRAEEADTATEMPLDASTHLERFGDADTPRRRR